MGAEVMMSSTRARATRTRSMQGLVLGLLLAGAGAASAQFGPGPGGPGAMGRPGAAAAEPPGPPMPVPAAVTMPRPTDAEIATVRAGLEKLDAKTRALLKKYPDLVQVKPPPPMSANTAIRPQLQAGFQQKHQDNLAVAKQGDAELLFMGDSITDFWRNAQGLGNARGGANAPPPADGVIPYAGKAVQDEYFGKWKVANYGIAGDTTQGVLYRLKDGEGAGIKPKAIMLMIGTNNTGRNSAGEIAEGVGAVVLELQKDFPEARILLLGIFPRGKADDPLRGTIAEINNTIKKLDDGKKVFYLDIGKGFLDASGNIPTDVMSDGLHPTSKGYEIWARAVIDPITAMMNGHAPPGR
ncbi:MAG TPA: GDSL-type esterase/lipase family protein [Steroidobacteraceae bacterium]|nr:GDSL-type esterase/lipase family protein [Steroidobacteraceae bacterium]